MQRVKPVAARELEIDGKSTAGRTADLLGTEPAWRGLAESRREEVFSKKFEIVARQVQKVPVYTRNTQPPLLARSQPRGPPYEDWFHETPRARPARLLRTRREKDA